MPTGTYVLELKRDKIPRDVVAQVLDYGSWVTTLTREQVIDLASEHLEVPFEAAFENVFGAAPPRRAECRAGAHHWLPIWTHRPSAS